VGFDGDLTSFDGDLTSFDGDLTSFDGDLTSFDIYKTKREITHKKVMFLLLTQDNRKAHRVNDSSYCTQLSEQHRKTKYS